MKNKILIITLLVSVQIFSSSSQPSCSSSAIVSVDTSGDIKLSDTMVIHGSSIVVLKNSAHYMADRNNCTFEDQVFVDLLKKAFCEAPGALSILAHTLESHIVELNNSTLLYKFFSDTPNDPMTKSYLARIEIVKSHIGEFKKFVNEKLPEWSLKEEIDKLKQKNNRTLEESDKLLTLTTKLLSLKGIILEEEFEVATKSAE